MEKGIAREQLVKDILEKKELSSLDPAFVSEKLDAFFRKRPDALKKLESISPRSEAYKKLIKEIRAQLREVYGVFIGGKSSRRGSMLESLDGPDDLETIDSILVLHKSSQERLSIYSEAYKEIFAVTGEPRSIIDLACGLNPISYPYLGCKPKYLACDISNADLAFIQSFFGKLKIDGRTRQVNLLTDDLSKLSEGYDVAFLFKALDSIETVKRNSSERVLSGLRCKSIVVSFATMSIGGRKPIRSSRKWFELMAQRLGFGATRLDFPGETFYVLRR